MSPTASVSEFEFQCRPFRVFRMEKKQMRLLLQHMNWKFLQLDFASESRGG